MGTKRSRRSARLITPHISSSPRSLLDSTAHVLFHQRYSVDTTSSWPNQPPPYEDEIARGLKDFDRLPENRRTRLLGPTNRFIQVTIHLRSSLSLIPKLPLGKESDNPRTTFHVSKQTTITNCLKPNLPTSRKPPGTSFASHVRGRTIKTDQLPRSSDNDREARPLATRE